MDGICPALDAICHDIGLALLVQFFRSQEIGELVYVLLLYGESAATAAE